MCTNQLEIALTRDEKAKNDVESDRQNIEIYSNDQDSNDSGSDI